MKSELGAYSVIAKPLSKAAILLLVIALLQPTSVAQSEPSRPSVDELKAKAEAGDAAAQCQFGLRYARGDGVAADLARVGRVDRALRVVPRP